MNDKEILIEAVHNMELHRDKLSEWITVSKEGGWSTHLVDPMEKEIVRLTEVIIRLKRRSSRG